MKRSEKKKQKNLKEMYKEVIDFIRDSKKYIFVVLIVFIVFALIGYFTKLPTELESLLMERLKEITLMFEGLNLPQTIWMIFSNNIYVSFLSIVLGILFGVFPIITSLSNGFIVGFVAHKAVSIDGILTLWRLFPHGIFEIPAVIISLGLGLRLGVTLIFRTGKIKEESKSALKVFTLLVTPMLIIAAIIEGILVFLVK